MSSMAYSWWYWDRELIYVTQKMKPPVWKHLFEQMIDTTWKVSGHVFVCYGYRFCLLLRFFCCYLSFCSFYDPLSTRLYNKRCDFNISIIQALIVTYQSLPCIEFIFHRSNVLLEKIFGQSWKQFPYYVFRWPSKLFHI